MFILARLGFVEQAREDQRHFAAAPPFETPDCGERVARQAGQPIFQLQSKWLFPCWRRS